MHLDSRFRVPSTRAAVAHIDIVDDGIPDRFATLDDPSTHEGYVVNREPVLGATGAVCYGREWQEVLERHTENFNLGKSWLIGDQTNALPQAQLRHLRSRPSRARDKWRTNKSRHWLNSRTSFLNATVESRQVSPPPPPRATSRFHINHIRLLPSKFRRDFVILGDCDL